MAREMTVKDRPDYTSDRDAAWRAILKMKVDAAQDLDAQDRKVLEPLFDSEVPSQLCRQRVYQTLQAQQDNGTGILYISLANAAINTLAACRKDGLRLRNDVKVFALMIETTIEVLRQIQAESLSDPNVDLNRVP